MKTTTQEYTQNSWT